MAQYRERGWFSRNWLWVVPLGCLTPIVLCVGIITIGVMFLFGVIKESVPYKEGLAAARENAEVKAALGEPVEAWSFVGGAINTNNVNGVETGRAELVIPISGPKDTGVLHIAAELQNGKWTYSKSQVTNINSHPAPIELGLAVQAEVKKGPAPPQQPKQLEQLEPAPMAPE